MRPRRNRCRRWPGFNIVIVWLFRDSVKRWTRKPDTGVDFPGFRGRAFSAPWNDPVHIYPQQNLAVRNAIFCGLFRFPAARRGPQIFRLLTLRRARGLAGPRVAINRKQFGSNLTHIRRDQGAQEPGRTQDCQGGSRGREKQRPHGNCDRGHARHDCDRES